MRKRNTLIAAAVLLPNLAWAASPTAQELAASAFQSPPIPFQSRLILTEWNGQDSHAEEVNLVYAPPGLYRIEFLGFDGSVKKVVVTDSAKSTMNLRTGEKGNIPVGYAPQYADLLTNQGMQTLLKKNYSFNLKGSESFIGRDVWLVEIIPQEEGKPRHELKIDKETLVVLEHRRYLPADKIGSLTRFSTFEPNKSVPADTFNISGSPSGAKKDFEVVSAGSNVPPKDMKDLPAGFSLSSFNVFEVEGTRANHFYYSDGALPLSIFETTLPVHFPERAKASDKMEFMIVPSYGLSSVDQIAYGKRNGKYITVIGEVSPSLLQTIARRFN